MRKEHLIHPRHLPLVQSRWATDWSPARWRPAHSATFGGEFVFAESNRTGTPSISAGHQGPLPGVHQSRAHLQHPDFTMLTPSYAFGHLPSYNVDGGRVVTWQEKKHIVVAAERGTSKFWHSLQNGTSETCPTSRIRADARFPSSDGNDHISDAVRWNRKGGGAHEVVT